MRHLSQFLLICAFPLCAPTLMACSCIGKASVEEARKGAEAVLLGKVIAEEIVEVQYADTLVPFSKHLRRSLVVVEHVFKGRRVKEQDTVVVYTGLGNGDCGFHFDLGGRYVIYAEDDRPYEKRYSATSPITGRGIFWTNICTRTRLYDESEVKALEALK